VLTPALFQPLVAAAHDAAGQRAMRQIAVV
jgi:hypothetical protein